MIAEDADIELTQFQQTTRPSRVVYDTFFAQLWLLLKAEMVSPRWRRPIGLFLLSLTVTLWTASGFLASVRLSFICVTEQPFSKVPRSCLCMGRRMLVIGIVRVMPATRNLGNWPPWKDRFGEE